MPGSTNEASVSTLSSTSDVEEEPFDISFVQCSQVEISGERPVARSSHSATLVDDTLVLFGGYGAGKERGDFCHIQKDSFKCSVVSPLGGSGTHCRVGHSSVTFSKHIYIYGGWNGTDYMDSGLLYDVTTMQLVVERNKGRTVPPARRDHACTILRNKMYVFGGWNCVDQFNDVWILDDSWNWSKSTTISDPPTARRGHSANVVGRFIFVFGGIYGYSKYLGDMFVFDTDNSKWFKVPIRGDAPSARAWHSAVTVGKYILVFGGAAGRTHFYNDLYAFDSETLRWRQIPIKGDRIEQRCSHTATLVGNKIIIFGGITPSNLENSIYPLDNCFSIDVDFAVQNSRDFDIESLSMEALEEPDIERKDDNA